ncbi:MAG: class I SAM-dependent methyltransferase [Patescibacteria group bacterium]
MVKNKKTQTTRLSKYEHVNSSVYGLVPDNFSVLDVGCWSGSLGVKLIREKKCEVDGIDNCDRALQLAQKRGYRRVFRVDLNQIKDPGIGENQYDVIVFADVLEHLLFPKEVLFYYLKHLKKNGFIVVSLPNIGFILYRLKLLLGFFDYKEIGVMDKTHVKFYTLKTMRELFKEVDLKIIKTTRHNEVASRFFFFHILKYIWPTLFTLQFVFLLQRTQPERSK